MQNIDIPLPTTLDNKTIETFIDAAIAQCGLGITLRDTLKKYPGSIHWHLKLGRKSGILEVTLWPEQHRAWFSVQSGRRAPWIADEISRLDELIRLRLWVD